ELPRDRPSIVQRLQASQPGARGRYRWGLSVALVVDIGQVGPRARCRCRAAQARRAMSTKLGSVHRRLSTSPIAPAAAWPGGCAILRTFPNDPRVLNGLWLAFFLIAGGAALVRWIGAGDADVFAAMVGALFDMARLSVEVMVLLFGTLTLWLGFLRIAEQAGLVDWLGRMLGPLFSRLMPEVPRGHPALGFITLNFAANGLGLDNAATPIGLH